MKQIIQFFVIISLLSFNHSLLFSQAPEKLWDATFGGNKEDEFYSMQQTSDGGYILGGESESGNEGDKTDECRGEADYWIIKTDASGSKQWDATFGGNEVEELVAIHQTFDGGYILGGTSTSDMSGDKSQDGQGEEDFWMVKTDANGVKQWDARFGGIKSDFLKSISQTMDGGYILGGTSGSGISSDKSQPSQGLYDYWIVKTDGNGVKQWDARFGSIENDYITSLQQTSDGGYILGGWTKSGISGDITQAGKGLADFWIVKTDASGVKQWDKRLGGAGSDILYALEQTSDGGYILGGDSNSGIGGDKSQASQGNNDYWLVKTDALGTKQWDARFGTSASEYFQALHQTPDGGYIAGGQTVSGIGGDKTAGGKGGSDFWIVKTDVNGVFMWDVAFGGGGSDLLQSIVLTSDGSYIFGGTSLSPASGDKSEDNVGEEDYWILKTNGGAAPTLIYTGIISPLLYPKGATVQVPYTASGLFDSNNVFSAQLSDVNGSFSSPKVIGTLASTMSGTITATLPTSGKNGISFRIRVVSSNPPAIGTDNGQDITVGCVVPSGTFTSNITSGGAVANWNIMPGALSYEVRYRPTTATDWITVSSSDNSKRIKGLAPGTEYTWQARSICDGAINSFYSAAITFFTLQLKTSTAEDVDFEISPNPLTNSAMISFMCVLPGKATIELYDLTGKKIRSLYSGAVEGGKQSLPFNRMQLPGGIYLVKLTMNSDVITRKVVLD